MGLTLEDVDRLLAQSADLERDGRAGQLRAWRDELSRAAVLLSYARNVLSVDLRVLRSVVDAMEAEATGTGTEALDAVVDDLPRLLAEASVGGGWTLSPDAPATIEAARQAVEEGAADDLLGPHADLARADLARRGVAAGLIGEVERQLTAVSRDREEVEARVREIQAALLQQYRDGQASVDDWLG